MDDLISRQAAIDALTEYWQGISDRHPTLDGEMAVYADCKGIIKRLPSAQPEPKWIPCSERLPKPFEHCLWTTTDGRVVYHHCDGLFSNYTAWMPLPEPYAERRTDEADYRKE